MKFSAAAISAAAFIAPALAQQGAWAQCGGKGWTGATTCVSGYVCTYSNDWYSQCIPGTATTTKTPTTTKAPTTTPAAPTTTLKTTTSAAGGSPTTTPSGPVASGSFASASGTQFVIDGKKGYFAGTNTYWIGFLTNNADVDGVMSQLQQNGLKILRVWGFNTITSATSGVWYQSLIPGQSPQINTGANGLQRLDYVVQSAAAHGIKLIINFTNNWSDYGGVPAYNTYYGTTQATWYGNAQAQATYQAYIKAVVSRYTNSSAVFAWELMNEPRCNGCSTSVIYNWAATTSAYIKSLDSKHMVTLGDEGFGVAGGDGTYPYQTGEGVDFSKNLGISTLDFGTYHMYPDSWGTNTGAWATGWIQTHATACIAANKPCLFEEYGYPSNHVAIESPWQATALATAGTAGDLFWQFGTVLASGSRTADDGNTIFTDNSAEWTALVTNHVAAIKAKNGF